jgi:hypothetical protein
LNSLRLQRQLWFRQTPREDSLTPRQFFPQLMASVTDHVWESIAGYLLGLEDAEFVAIVARDKKISDGFVGGLRT